MICPHDPDISCPYTEEMLSHDPELCAYCDPESFLEDVDK